MKDKKIKKIPYGVTDYDRIIKKNCYYVDKTMYLAEIENAGDYLFFIRPRRFGKSLFASVMESHRGKRRLPGFDIFRTSTP